jgi:addiction module RelE/StbE family toxin
MEEYKVSISDGAKKDLLNIYNYIHNELCAPVAVESLMESLSKAMLSLTIFPERCSVIEALLNRGYTFRQLIVKKYRIIYHVIGNEVIIVSIVYGSRHLDNW